MARSDFSEMNLYFYLHRINDHEVIDYVKNLKASRKLNSLVLSLLRDHISKERQSLLAGLLESEKQLGFLPDISETRYIPRDLIDLDDLSKSILKIESELCSLKKRLSTS